MSRLWTLITANLLFIASIMAGGEQRTVSLNGNILQNDAVIWSQDQYYPYMQDHPLSGGDPYSDDFCISSSVANVTFRFDDTKQDYYASDWTITVNFDIELWDESGSSNTITNQSLTVSYDTQTGYTDIDMVQYKDVHKAQITIHDDDATDALDGVVLTNAPGGVVPDDVYLDLQINTNRIYVLNESETTEPGFRYLSGTNELELFWHYIEGAESYDVEWVFVDIGQGDSSAAWAFDFDDATRINTPNHQYRIPMAYPRGIIVYRVRGVGFSDCTTKQYADWSYEPAATDSTDDVPTIGSVISYVQKYEYFGLEKEMNWQHQAVYSEDGKRKDIITYFDGSFRNREMITVLNTDSNAVVSQTLYDTIGRPAIQVLPVPLTYAGLNYYEDLTLRSSGDLYSPKNFDTDAKLSSPDLMDTINSLGAPFYYSLQNGSPGGINGQYVPSAEAMPYSRTVWWNDGSNRIKTQSGAGDDLGQGSGREIQYFYASPTGPEEVDRLFGNEVGYVNHYKKNISIDPNGQASVTYVDINGRTVATALIGDAADPYHEIDGKPAADTVTATLTAFNHLNTDNEWVISHTFFVSGTSVDYTFVYSLDTANFCSDCLPSPDECVECRYDLVIMLTDQNGDSLDINDVDAGFYNYIYSDTTGIPQADSIEFTVELNTGTYTIHKILSLNEDKLDTAWLNYYDSQTCISEPSATSNGDCTPSCSSACWDHYTFVNTDGDTVYVNGSDVVQAVSSGTTGYIISGDSLDRETVRGLINTCVSDCGELAEDTNSVLAGCEWELILIEQAMSPGGQYYDYLPVTTVSGTDSIDEWLIANVWANGSTNFDDAFGTSSDPDRNWQWVRENWDDTWVSDFDSDVGGKDGLREYHPEWCQFDHYCLDSCQATFHPDPEIYYGAEEYDAYYDTMFTADGIDYWDGSNIDVDEVLFNPTNLPQGGDTTSTSGRHHYQPFVDTLEYFERDPYFAGDACHNILRDSINKYLLDFLPVADNPDTSQWLSLWYVIEDPENIHLDYASAPTMPADVDSIFVALHGDGTRDGLIGTGADQITEYEFFVSVYAFLREMVMYNDYQDNYSSPCTDFLCSPNDDGLDEDGFAIVYQCNPLFENWRDFDDWIEAEADTACWDACSNSAEGWWAILEKDSCVAAADADSVKHYFIEVCKLGCSDSTAVGSSLGDGGTSYFAGVDKDDVATNFYDFGDIIDAYEISAGACEWIEHPHEYVQDSCECDKLHDFFDSFVESEGLTGVDEPDDLSASEQTTFSSYLDDIEATGESVSFSDYSDWWDTCAVGLVHTGLMEAFECGKGAIPQLPNDPIAAFADTCAQSLDSLDYFNALQTFIDDLVEAAQAYQDSLIGHCMNEDSLMAKEEFTVTYPLNEYYYTLYYYDQADNLIKTVPPAGVTTLSVVSGGGEDVYDVADYRSDTTGQSFIHPGHDLITHYKYNSLQQLIMQYTPDGDTTIFYYDAVGRLVASQNGKQKELGTYGYYSYTVFDALGRVTEVGQIDPTETMTDCIAKDGSGCTTYSTWLSNGTKDQVTRTYYDTIINTVIDGQFTEGQNNLRNRISTVSYEESDDGFDSTYNFATHYSYDIHGNVETLIQEFPELDSMEQRYKHMYYEYDLVSGNVNEIRYEPGKFDEFYHRYCYDADNRITGVFTSSDGEIYELDKKYFYYEYGPLARIETGDMQVQGCDYAYTINGWVKGMNSGSLYTNRDIGNDADASSGINTYFGTDATGLTLGYFNGDYLAVGNPSATDKFEIKTSDHPQFADANANLYNGNIGNVVTAFLDENTVAQTQAMVYGHDQLNRLRYGESNTGDLNAGSNTWGSSHTVDDDYRLRVHYDMNGNIDTLIRYGYGANLDMDSLYYNYNTGTNQLNYVDDLISSVYNTDIDDQSSNNFAYDSIGQLTQDILEGINSGGITWTVRNKISTITRSGTGTGDDIEFKYDAMDNRVVKIVKPDGADQDEWTYTYYVRDAQGNVLTTYERKYSDETTYYTDTIYVDESYIYGNSRGGSYNSVRGIGGTFTATISGGVFTSVDYTAFPDDDVVHYSVSGSDTIYEYDRYLGEKQYELVNHQGNVLSVISDLRQVDNFTGVTVDNYKPEILAYNDYYPFGMEMPGRNLNVNSYQYGFQGQEEDPEFWNGAVSYKYRVEDPRLGRFFSVDPLQSKYPYYSPYAFSGNRLIDMIELEGLEPFKDGTVEGMVVTAPQVDNCNVICNVMEQYMWKWTGGQWINTNDDPTHELNFSSPTGFLSLDYEPNSAPWANPDMSSSGYLGLSGFMFSAAGALNKAAIKRMNEARLGYLDRNFSYKSGVGSNFSYRQKGGTRKYYDNRVPNTPWDKGESSSRTLGRGLKWGGYALSVVDLISIGEGYVTDGITLENDLRGAEFTMDMFVNLYVAPEAPYAAIAYYAIKGLVGEGGPVSPTQEPWDWDVTVHSDNTVVAKPDYQPVFIGVTEHNEDEVRKFDR